MAQEEGVPSYAKIIEINIRAFVARGFIPVGLRSGPQTSQLGMSERLCSLF
jgi:hypothetical protein